MRMLRKIFKKRRTKEESLKANTLDFTHKFEQEFILFATQCSDKKIGKDMVDLYIDYRRKMQERYAMPVDRKLKKRYAWAILAVLYSWTLFVITIISLSAFSKISLSDTILAILLTSATMNILALPAIILKHLFTNNSKHNNYEKTN